MKTETRRDGSIQLADWWEDLLWPKVLGAAALGLRPARIGLAFFGMVLGLALLAVGQQVDAWLGRTGAAVPLTWGQEPTGALLWVWRWFVEVPVSFVQGWPATTILFLVVIWPMWLVVIGAVSRMVAVEFSRGDFLSWTEALAFSLSRWKSLLGAMLGPLLVVWGIALLIAAAGWLLLSWTGMNAVGSGIGVVGGIVYGLAIVLGIVASLVSLVYVVGHSLLVPAVVCEGADAIDAIQRGYAYTLDRPVRLIVYMILAFIGLVFVVGVVSVIVCAGVGFAGQAAGVWSGDAAREIIYRGTMRAFPIPSWQAAGGPMAGRLTGSTVWLVGLWTMIPVYGLIACLLSCCWASTTVVYLAIRRVCDGQDTAELWMPGMIEGVMAESLRGRAEAAGTQGSAGAVGDSAEEVEET